MDTKTKTSKISTQIGIYRANITPLDRLLKTTVGRKDLLGDLIEKLDRNAGKKGGQHYLFIGPRGIGKTHFLTLVENEINQDERLKSRYTVIRFPEENNRILSFADLLLGISEILGESTDSKEWQELYKSLSENEKDEEIIDTIIPRLKQYKKKTKKILLILLENLDTLFTQQIKNEQDMHRIRSFLMDSPCAALIGTSPVYFSGLSNLQSPLYDFFDIQVIEDLSEEQTLEIIRKNLEWEHCTALLEDFDLLIPKIKAMHTMTGGNPRLIIILYELIANDNLMEVKIQFQELLDRISPFYQERMKDLAPQERALLETMALMRTEPRTPANISRRLRKSQQQTSSLLKRMTKTGYLTVSENPRDKRSRLYRIKEGFFDLWLAMSESRVQKKRLGYLVEFFEMYYRDRDEREKKRKDLWKKLESKAKREEKKENHFELLDYLSEIGDTIEKCRSKLELAVYKIKEGSAKEAAEFLTEVESISPEKPSFIWMTDQARRWAEGTVDLDITKWLDDMIDYWRTQRSGNLENAVTIAHKLGRDISGRGLHAVRVDLLGDALEKTKDPKEKFKLNIEIAQSQRMAGQLSAALKSLQEALSISRDNGDRSGEGTSLNNIGQIYDTRGDYDTALKYLQDSLKISRDVGDRSGEGTSLNNISQVYKARRDYDMALTYLQDSLKISREIGNRSVEGTSLSNIGNIYFAKGDYDTALKYLLDALNIRRDIGDRSSEGASLNNISQIYYARGDYDTALKYLLDALNIRRDIGDRSGEGTSLNNISQIYYARGDYDSALKYLLDSLNIRRNIGDRSGEGTSLSNIGNIYYARGDYDTALKYLQDALSFKREIGDRSGEGAVLNNISQIYNERGDYDSTLKYLQDALNIMRQIGNRSGEGTTLNNISQIYYASGDYDTALKYLQKSLTIRREIGDRSGEIPTLHNMAMIEYQRKNTENMIKLEMEAYQLSMETGNAMGLFEVGRVLGHILLNSGQRNEGIIMLRQSYKIGSSAGLPRTDELKKSLLKLGEKV